MKPLLLLIYLFVFQGAFGQRTTPVTTGNPYRKYTGSTFECRFRSTGKTISALHRATGKSTSSNFLTSGFGSDSTYRIILTIAEVIDSKIREREYVFEGKYTIDQQGNIVLSGKHPFSTDVIRIQEKKHARSIYTLRYKFKLNSDFKTINDRKLFAYCDGSCVIPPEE